MKPPAHDFAYQVLLLQAADDGRGPVLFGESLKRAREAVLPFLVGPKFPSVYLEHPLIGSPFLDVTVLYDQLEPKTRIASELAEGSDAMLDWFASVCGSNPGICCGFELDTKDPRVPRAAVHFQPRSHIELVPGFFEAIGEPERSELYLGLAARMPKAWQLSFFGAFRGRPGSPLRVCGYLDTHEVRACAEDPSRLAKRFDEIGFCAYDGPMLEQARALMSAAPSSIDFQFDAYPDGSLGSVFAIDARFGIDQPETVRASFSSGAGARLMGLLEGWGAADARWKLGAQASFARAIPVEPEDGSLARFAFTLMPMWVKARWSDGVLQPSKLYLHASAGMGGQNAESAVPTDSAAVP